MGLTLIFKDRPRRSGGYGAKGVIVPSENGEPGIFVPSFGILEQEEIDYIVGVEKEKKHERLTPPRRVSIGTDKNSYEVEVKEV